MLVSITSGCASEHILSWSPSPGRMVITGRASGVQNTLGCMAGLTLALVCIAAAGRLVVEQ